MTGLTGDAAQPLKGLSEVATGGRELPPVHLWNPPFCGAIPMRIGRDGIWHYMNSPIGRKPLYKLFSRILRRDADGVYYLVTPVEKCAIEVEDAPFFAIRMSIEGAGRGQIIRLETNCDDMVTVDADHPLRFEEEQGTEGLKPYVLVRANLEALVARPLFYDLAAAGVVDGEWFGVWSSGVFFPMQKAAEIGLGA